MNAPIPFDAELPPLDTVGGKALALMRLALARRAIPSGFTLPVGFFDGWLAEVARAVPFETLAHEPEVAGARLKQAVQSLEPSAAQRDAVAAALDRLAGDRLLAVRSSSPDEDTARASFAGGYESVLGVARSSVWPAIRTTFGSCFDARVAAYKRRHGLDPTRPRIAVVVQELVAAEVAGVAFSVDPITHDERVVVINANWGLGDSVVSGIATPDEIRVDKAARRVLAHTVGDKESATRPRAGGGTEEYVDARAGEPCLSGAQALAIVDEVVHIERGFGGAVDVEWAWDARGLHVLQARAVTTLRR